MDDKNPVEHRHFGLYDKRESVVSPLEKSRTSSATRPGAGSFRSHRRRRAAVRRFLVTVSFILLLGYLAVTLVIIARKGVNSLGSRTPVPPEAPAAVRPATGTPPAVSPALPGGSVTDRLVETSDDVKAVLDDAYLLTGRGLLPEALAKLRRAQANAPDNIQLQYELANLYVQVHQHDEALALLYSVLRKMPAHVNARRKLAELFFIAEQYDEAFKAGRWVLAANASDPDAHRILARASMKTARYEQAITHWRFLLDAGLDPAEARRNMAMANLQLGRFGKAIMLFEEALKDDPRDALSYQYLALAFTRQEQVEETVLVLSRAAEHLGSETVIKWTDSGDYDDMKDDPVFAAFRKRMYTPDASMATLTPRDTAGERPIDITQPNFDDKLRPVELNPRR